MSCTSSFSKICTILAVVGLVVSLTLQSQAQFLIERGGDISEVTANQRKGTIYQDWNGVDMPEPLKMCKVAGWSVAAIRLFVNPSGNDYEVNNLPVAIDQAKRAKAQGMKILLGLHYTDGWDNVPVNNSIPAVWRGQSYSQLKTTVRNYTIFVMTSFRNAGVLPDYIKLGNEVGQGFLGPIGAPFDVWAAGGPAPSNVWRQFIGLQKAAISGVRAVSSTTKVMIHIQLGNYADGVVKWFDAYTRDCPGYDLIGISYYPFSAGSEATDLSDIRETLDRLHNRYPGKKIWIVEFSYAWNWGIKTGNVYWNDPRGQYLCTRDLGNLLASYSDGGGFCYWGAFMVPNPAFPYDWGKYALFETSWYSPDGGKTWVVNPRHKALPAFGALAR